MKADPSQLERLVLSVVATSETDDWLALSIGNLTNRVSEVEETVDRPSFREVVDCICDLSKREQMKVQKFNGVAFIPLESVRCEDDTYLRQFFGQGDFQMRLTHDGRKALKSGETPQSDLSAESAPNQAAQFDDRLPLFRRRVFDADLIRFSREAVGNDTSLALAMIDVDHFKAINDDAQLHPVGDDVLLGVAKVFEARTKGKGNAYRYGGDEFALLLPNYTIEEAIALGETIRKQVERSTFSTKKLKVTLSLGLAAVPEHAKTADELLEMADGALYRAKNLGRNLVRVSGESEAVRRDRSPARKSPVPGTLSEEDRERIRLAHFSTHNAACPKDGTRLKIVDEFHEVSKRGLSIIVLCPICGLQDVISAPD
jgi:diguanylate cyclase (GGDEF)-like protein